MKAEPGAMPRICARCSGAKCRTSLDCEAMNDILGVTDCLGEMRSAVPQTQWAPMVAEVFERCALHCRRMVDM